MSTRISPDEKLQGNIVRCQRLLNTLQCAIDPEKNGDQHGQVSSAGLVNLRSLLQDSHWEDCDLNGEGHTKGAAISDVVLLRSAGMFNWLDPRSKQLFAHYYPNCKKHCLL